MKELRHYSTKKTTALKRFYVISLSKSTIMRWKIWFLVGILGFVGLNLFGQAPKKPNAAELQHALNKLNVLGSALYIAAHPDDENTRLISYLTNEELMNTAYLSLTRGDGGQNLIGSEIREELGIIRTQELLAARRIDGGKQFFSRANDFGYSKHPDETFTIWDREQVLADVVWVIRSFRPDVLITRFSTEPGTTHGHHTASSILAEEAYAAAADPKRFREQLQYVDVWQAKRLLFNTSWWFYGSREAFAESPDKEKMIQVDAGKFNPLLGLSYSEIAATSRSQHKCQAMGTAGTRGERIEYLLPLQGKGSNKAVFDGINTTWSRLEGGAVVGKLLEDAAINFDVLNPSGIVPQLIEAKKALELLEPSAWQITKLAELNELIYGCMGLYLEAVADDYSATFLEDINLEVEVINRSDVKVELLKVEFSSDKTDTTLNQTLENNKSLKFKTQRKVFGNLTYTQPYWLEKEGTLGMFAVDQQLKIGMPENDAPLFVDFKLKIAGESFTFQKPIVYKWTDDQAGELYRPFSITPPVFANIAEKVVVFADEEPQEIQVLVKAGKDDLNGYVELAVPDKWTVKPKRIAIEMAEKGAEELVRFELYPPDSQSTGDIKAMVTSDGKTYDHALVDISYDHIPTQTLFPKAKAKVVKLDIQKKGERIAYIKGAGDVIPESLRQIGYQVDELSDDQVTKGNLKGYDAVVLGVRVFNKRERMKFHVPILMDYVKNGGTVVAQYNTTYSLLTEEIAPYPLTISRDRVTVEEAEVRFLAPKHPVLNEPNKITEADFEGWVQERGLYFPNEWDAKFTPILSANDPEEDPKDGGLLVAEYGDGHFVYTGYSFFRELPAGVAGAYRLFANLVSLGN